MQATWILVFLYALLMFIYGWYIPNTQIQPWELLPTRQEVLKVTTCLKTADCPLHHICLGGECIPLLLRGGKCDSATGTWTLTEIQGQAFAICTCKYPHFMNQKYLGGNCDVDVACGAHGRYNVFSRECECDDGYMPLPHPYPRCHKLTALERIKILPCEPDEVEFDLVEPSHGFHPNYIAIHENKKCFKRPCTFDAFTGRPLKHGRYEDGVGCLCDPTKGMFGVRLDSFKEYVRGPGYNACASIFTQDLDEPINVNLYAYFYLLNRPPVAFIQFRSVPTGYLIPELKTEGQVTTLQIGQEWPYDYMQYVFKERFDYSTRTRSCSAASAFYNITCNEFEYRPNQMIDCRDLTLKVTVGLPAKMNFYTLMYQYPVCRIDPSDDRVAKRYRGRYILNPLPLLVKRYPDLFRSNGVVCKHRQGEWELDYAEGYDIGTYLLDVSHVPNLLDSITEGLEDGILGIRAEQYVARQQERVKEKGVTR